MRPTLIPAALIAPHGFDRVVRVAGLAHKFQQRIVPGFQPDVDALQAALGQRPIVFRAFAGAGEGVEEGVDPLSATTASPTSIGEECNTLPRNDLKQRQ